MITTHNKTGKTTFFYWHGGSRLVSASLSLWWTHYRKKKIFMMHVRKNRSCLAALSDQAWVEQITAAAWAETMMHHEHSVVWTRLSARQDLKQLLSNETNIPWQLMMENSEPNWENAVLRHIEIYLQAVGPPTRRGNFCRLDKCVNNNNNKTEQKYQG